jgi:hypothetical protein
MPTFTDIPFDYSTLSLSPEKDKPRSAGLHLTDITKHRLSSFGINRAGKGTYDDNQRHMLFEHGFLWERIVGYILNQTNSGEIVRPGEVCLDGIYATPDAINVVWWHLEEWKSTYVREKNMVKTLRNGSTFVDIATHKPEWLWQAMAYCRFFNMTRVIFRIWFWGDMPARVRQVQVDFTPAEIEQNWYMILNQRDYMIKLGVITK